MEDVARLAEVSLATVDRVLNERGSVAPDTARRVIEIARQVGLRRTLPKPYVRSLRVDVLLARSDTPYFFRVRQAFAQIAATVDRSIIIQRSTLPEAKPNVFARRIRETKADGVIIYCEDDPEIRRAIAATADAGIPTICLTTDVPDAPRFTYVGIDNTQAGRTAGLLVAKMARHAGPAIALTNSLGYRAHKERLSGLQAGLAAHAPAIEIAAILETHDEADRAFSLLTHALGRFPDAVALYNMGGANRAVAAAIGNRGMAGAILFIGHELTEASAKLLAEGIMTVTIDQAPELQARRSIDLILGRFGVLDAAALPGNIPFTLHTQENL
ncbi:MAG: LacI family DNA-binding transcriptional regulator [Acetobacteraceae bacterium]|nr:LacI family DNA-binding transcriptional regulator [Acetobacteraceae bacterium]